VKMRTTIILLLVIVSISAYAMPPLVPSQIDGQVFDGGPVIGASVKAYIDANSNGKADNGESYYEATSLDLKGTEDDGYYRILIKPENYVSGETDVVIIAKYSGKEAKLAVMNIQEGTSFGHDLNLIVPEDSGSGGSGGGSGGSSKRGIPTTTSIVNQTTSSPNEIPDDDESPDIIEVPAEMPEEPKVIAEQGMDDSQELPHEEAAREEEIPVVTSGFSRLTGAVLGGGVGTWASAMIVLCMVLGLFLLAYKRRSQEYI
jgi:hypothetical protein